MSDKKINMDNYEAFLIDMLDGKLSKEKEEELMCFLELHPDIKEEVLDIEDFILTPDDDVKSDFHELKKDEDLVPPMPFGLEDTDMIMAADLEGDLDDEYKEALRVLLSSNKKFKAERELFAKTKLVPDGKISFEGKESLYRLDIMTNAGINGENVEEYIVAYHQGDLSDAEKAELEKYIAGNKELESDFKTYSALKMKADESIVYPDKAALKKRVPVILFGRTALRIVTAAAAILILMLVFPGLLNNNSTVIINKNRRINTGLNLSFVKKQAINYTGKAPDTVKGAQANRGFVRSNKLREKVLIAKANSLKPQTHTVLPAMEGTSYKPLTLVYQKPLEGYYEVKLERETFVKRNPKFVKKVVAGVRKFLHVSPKELNLPDDKLTLWDIADAGLKGIGAMTENDFSLSKK